MIARPMRVVISIDLEHDCPPFLQTYRGMEKGVGRFLDVLKRAEVAGTFFATGDVARRFPATMDRIVAAGHELGCHGDSHRRFSTMGSDEAEDEIIRSSRTLRQHGPVVSFRAPNLDMPERHLPLLTRSGYRFDSSVAAYKLHKGHPNRPRRIAGLLQVPASTTPSAVRLPRLMRNFILGQQRDPVMLFFHPWEFVDMTHEPIPLDCRFRTGEAALDALAAAITELRRRGGRFVTAAQLLADDTARKNTVGEP